MKHINKISALFLSFILLISSFIIAETKESFLLGDANTDGNITAADARITLLNSAGLYADIETEKADIDNDSKITAIDARYILRAAAKLESLVCIRYGHDIIDGCCVNCSYTVPETEPDSEAIEQTTAAESWTEAVSETISVTETTTEEELTTIPETTTKKPETTTELTTAVTTVPETTTEITTESTTTDETTAVPETTTTAPEESTTAPETTTTVPEESTTAPEITTESTTRVPETTEETTAETTTVPETTTKEPETTTEITTKPTTADETTTVTEPESVTTAPAETTTVPEITTTAPEEFTTAPETTTTAPEESTSTPETTTAAPEESTTAPETTTTAPEESTTAPEITTESTTRVPETTEETTTETTTVPETTTKPVSTEELAYETFLLINEYRASLGLYPLIFNAELSEITSVRSKEASVRWSHTRPDSRDFWTVFDDYNKFNNVQVGEILAKTGAPDASRAVYGWQNSPSHNAILTTTKYNQIGIACYIAEDGYTYFAAHTIKTNNNESTTVPEESTTTGTTTPPVSTEDLAYETFLIINEYRASHGLYPLTFNAELSEITLARAKEISVCWSSTRPDGRDFDTIFDDYNKFNTSDVSEIFSKFTTPVASQVVSSLYNSPFNDIMLTSTFNQIGIAYYLAENGYYYFVIHTIQ